MDAEWRARSGSWTPENRVWLIRRRFSAFLEPFSRYTPLARRWFAGPEGTFEESGFGWESTLIHDLSTERVCKTADQSARWLPRATTTAWTSVIPRPRSSDATPDSVAPVVQTSSTRITLVDARRQASPHRRTRNRVASRRRSTASSSTCGGAHRHRNTWRIGARSSCATPRARTRV